MRLVDTDFNVPKEKLDRFAANYTRTPDKKFLLEDDPVGSPYTRLASRWANRVVSGKRKRVHAFSTNSRLVGKSTL